jgi:hypothetical protein
MYSPAIERLDACNGQVVFIGSKISVLIERYGYEVAISRLSLLQRQQCRHMALEPPDY